MGIDGCDWPWYMDRIVREAATGKIDKDGSIALVDNR